MKAHTTTSLAAALPFVLMLAAGPCAGEEVSRQVQTPYTEQKVVFDFYFDNPEKINSALYWIRSLMNPLLDAPYDMSPEQLDIKVVVHGTEIVALARKNQEKYRDAVDRMRYYASLGVQFKVCGIAAQDYGYPADAFHEFVDVVPSAITELAHWQLQGYALITPVVMQKNFSIEEIR
jgi:intracellular sulfur oxidation DsrE/DsrF family protein